MMGGRKEKGTNYRELEKKKKPRIQALIFLNVFSVSLFEVASGHVLTSPPTHTQLKTQEPRVTENFYKAICLRLQKRLS